MALSLKITKNLLQQIFDQAQNELPFECCGLGAGSGNQISQIFPMENEKKSEMAYAMKGIDLMRCLKQIDQLGLTPNLIYHSHTHTEAYPSQTDITLATFPDAYYLIVSLKNHTPQARVFLIRGEQVEEVSLEVLA